MNTEQLIAKYGEPGANQVYCKLPYKMKLAWAPEVQISRFSCHELVKDKLESIFEETLACYGIISIENLGLDMFGGCLNIRNKRNGSTLSLHSWGIAVDLDPLNNKLKWGRDKARFAKPDYETFWKIVEAHGGVSLGRELNYDWMHFQFEK